MDKLKATGGLTIRDVARITGYSRSTVSLALNDSDKIREETKKLILETISRVGYVPNPAARALGFRSRQAVSNRRHAQSDHANANTPTQHFE
ncbi:LacI family DNA-binding transcriptional regulator [Candidatus Poribacteria bacterium]|nr:LacI family DNA-binding transcriptional regulator [Candidatus Poribacteria bacterium]